LLLLLTLTWIFLVVLLDIRRILRIRPSPLIRHEPFFITAWQLAIGEVSPAARAF
jgi:hypothetical protein